MTRNGRADSCLRKQVANGRFMHHHHHRLTNDPSMPRVVFTAKGGPMQRSSHITVSERVSMCRRALPSSQLQLWAALNCAQPAVRYLNISMRSCICSIAPSWSSIHDIKKPPPSNFNCRQSSVSVADKARASRNQPLPAFNGHLPHHDIDMTLRQNSITCVNLDMASLYHTTDL
ncbi:hypothetical protein BU25DRAFT_414719 [Macroventuria anomochaeta]|uniref:Uncharacterized protein n=1 Tax=Macroventuria anomochaeta TaxID=301207 RepID=A0ACB6RNR1_9PLEO|nr:uncharacterized protein BU25DRAFT_414719 [Macroventuria anomochaeta]KAF2622947.1 hypothetical protein BU25DRAFT_414719 [Macroventuria anomochaeta]